MLMFAKVSLGCFIYDVIADFFFQTMARKICLGKIKPLNVIYL